MFTPLVAGQPVENNFNIINLIKRKKYAKYILFSFNWFLQVSFLLLYLTYQHNLKLCPHF
ncbi:hypothetical protein GCM10008905_28030 [Clostridium malenominatum]|uniref:Uncharacterized protein n=1 Tax=Clostridium malenominatum TaxID=1539 RepID=A0ABP3UCW8_9CLOT